MKEKIDIYQINKLQNILNKHNVPVKIIYGLLNINHLGALNTKQYNELLFILEN